ncbi:MAG TPA: metallophosphoesterase [Thermoanaerobaculia bacterium]|nr:metallophosphoesterase [Thermoanaerobaculia bacterium]
MKKRYYLLILALVALLGLADAFWIEPHLLLFRDVERIDLAVPRMRIAHLSDLHIRGDMPLLHRLLNDVAAVRPDLIVISGDLIHDVPEPESAEKIAATTAAYIASLRRIAPVYAIQGHSEHQGELVDRLDRAGLTWLSNEGRRIGPDGGILLLGLNTQVGEDYLAWSWKPPFEPLKLKGIRLYGARRGQPYRNFFSHYDPSPTSLGDTGGPLAWSGYEVACDAWIDDADTGVGLSVHSHYVVGDDRMIQFHRDGSQWDQTGAFSLIASGSGFDGPHDRLSSGVNPKQGRWYHLKVRTEVLPDHLQVLAKAWPTDQREPRGWQAHAQNHSSRRPVTGTVGLWASGGGTVVYRNLKVVNHDGRMLLNEPLALPPGADKPSGFRVGTRGTRLAMALARSPQVPPGTPVVALSHMADVAREAAWRGLDAVIAGHTHGGQVRLPFVGALTTRSALGAYYDHGRFDFPAPNARGLTTLFINSGVGMSVLPVRFWCPPRWAVLEVGR